MGWDTDREEVLHIFVSTNRVSLVNNYIFMVIRVGGRVREKRLTKSHSTNKHGICRCPSVVRILSLGNYLSPLDLFLIHAGVSHIITK